MLNNSFSLGDHLRSPRGAYWHHGIYIGAGLVVHFAGDARKDTSSASIRIGTIEEFCDGHPISVVRYATATLRPELAVENALSMVGRKGYSLVSRNCEHLAVWAKTGKWLSHQVETAKGIAFAAGLLWLLTRQDDDAEQDRAV